MKQTKVTLPLVQTPSFFIIPSNGGGWERTLTIKMWSFLFLFVFNNNKNFYLCVSLSAICIYVLNLLKRTYNNLAALILSIKYIMTHQ